MIYKDINELKDLIIDKTIKLNELNTQRATLDQAYRDSLSEKIEEYRAYKGITFIKNAELTLESENKEAKLYKKELNSIEAEITNLRNELEALNVCVGIEQSLIKRML